MADPRGLSGAVFQPTQIRDFTKDLLVSNQYKAKEQAASQKKDENYLSQFDVGSINNAAHRKLYMDKILSPIKSKMIEVADLKQSNPQLAREAQRELDSMTRDALVAVPAFNALDESARDAYKSLEQAKDYAGVEGQANVNAYNEFVDTPETWDIGFKNGELKFGDKYFLEELRPQRFSFNEPYSLQADIVDYYNIRTVDGVPDRNDALKELQRAKNDPRQQRQFYTFLKEQKGYNEDRIKSAIEADSEGLVQEFYDYALGELVSSRDVSNRSDSNNSGGDKDTKSLNDISEVFTLDDSKAIKLRPRAIYFDTTESMEIEDPNDEEKMIKKPFGVNANLINYAVDSKGDIIGTFVYYTTNGISERKSRKLSNEDIASIETNLPEGETLKSFYQKKVGGSSVAPKKQTEVKKGKMSGF